MICDVKHVTWSIKFTPEFGENWITKRTMKVTIFKIKISQKDI